MTSYFENKFSKLGALNGEEYDGCEFNACNFHRVSLKGIEFIDCVFNDCDLSLANLSQSSFKNVQFIGCKLTGLRFDYCNPFLFEITLTNCIANLCSFYELNLKNIVFKETVLSESDFTACDLTNAYFDQCDLNGATFDRTNLEKADLRTATNYRIDPDQNNVKNSQFSLAGLPGLLNKYQIIVVP